MVPVAPGRKPSNLDRVLLIREYHSSREMNVSLFFITTPGTLFSSRVGVGCTRCILERVNGVNGGRREDGDQDLGGETKFRGSACLLFRPGTRTKKLTVDRGHFFSRQPKHPSSGIKCGISRG